MYQRERSARAGKRCARRKSRLPLYAFVLAAAAFVMAFTFPEERPEEPGGRTSLVRTLSRTSGQLPAGQGTEPSIPDGTEDWMLLLVNPWNPLPEDFTCTRTQLANGQSVDERCYPDLQAMMDGCRAAGLSPLICSSYRTQETQARLFEQEVERWLGKGYMREEAEAQAARWVARPGASEHQTGLAVDIVDAGYQVLDQGQQNTAVQRWLMEHCAEYGFILRYPTDKSALTGVGYEPWHYRYVGEAAAREIMDGGLCLEEYFSSRRAGNV